MLNWATVLVLSGDLALWSLEEFYYYCDEAAEFELK